METREYNLRHLPLFPLSVKAPTLEDWQSYLLYGHVFFVRAHCGGLFSQPETQKILISNAQPCRGNKL
jgi:hypothetical protein